MLSGYVNAGPAFRSSGACPSEPAYRPAGLRRQHAGNLAPLVRCPRPESPRFDFTFACVGVRRSRPLPDTPALRDLSASVDTRDARESSASAAFQRFPRARQAASSRRTLAR
jgi:hypothetical protein